MSATTRADDLLEGLVVRDLRRRDVEAVAVVEADRHPSAVWTASQFHDVVDAPDRFVALVLVDPETDQAIAYGVLQVGLGTADLDNLTVRADHERRGLGRALLGELLVRARRAAADEVLLEVRHDNAPAIALYESAGFATISTRRGYYGPGQDALVMRLDLQEETGG